MNTTGNIIAKFDAFNAVAAVLRDQFELFQDLPTHTTEAADEAAEKVLTALAALTETLDPEHQVTVWGDTASGWWVTCAGPHSFTDSFASRDEAEAWAAQHGSGSSM